LCVSGQGGRCRPQKRWPWAIFGVLLTAGIVAVIHPVSTFAGLTDILGPGDGVPAISIAGCSITQNG
jgi:hypothetical protein